jgi:hypothetical protein
VRLRDFIHGPQRCLGPDCLEGGFWHVVKPTEVFTPGWHIDCVAEHLEAVSSGQIRKLVINIPPGHMKSLLVNVFWPSWHWGELDAGYRWLFASYDESLVYRDATSCLELLRSQDYLELYPRTRVEGTSPAIGEYYTTVKGLRFGTSVGGRVIGWHFHVKNIDDPLKPLALESRTQKALQTVITWLEGTVATRNIDPKRVATVLTMQRLHDRDPSEVLLEQGYEHLCIPFEYVPKCTWDRGSSIKFDDPRRVEGELMWPERFDRAAADELKRSMKTHSNISAQLQQNPTPEKGSFVERDWFEEYDELPPEHGLTWFQTWDLADKGSQESHSSVSGVLWAYNDTALYLVDEFSRVINYPETKRIFGAHQGRAYNPAAQRWDKDPVLARQYVRWLKARFVLVEEKASGIQLIQELKSEFPTLRPENPQGSKEDRMRVSAPTVEARQVKVPKKAWAEAWLDEVVGFPRYRKNDRVDTFTMAERQFRAANARYHTALKKLATMRI